MSKFFIENVDYQNKGAFAYAVVHSKKEVSKEAFLDELTYQKCEYEEYLCANGEGDGDEDVICYYNNLKEEILSNQFPDKEYNLEI